MTITPAAFAYLSGALRIQIAYTEALRDLLDRSVAQNDKAIATLEEYRRQIDALQAARR